MNLQQRIQLHRLKHKPIQTIVLEDNDFILQGSTIQQQQQSILIESDEEYTKPKLEMQLGRLKIEHKPPPKPIHISDPIRPKLDPEYEDEPQRLPTKVQPIVPVMKPQVTVSPFEQVQKKIASQVASQPALQTRVEVIKTVIRNDNYVKEQVTPIQISYNQFKLMKLKEVQEYKVKQQIEEEKRKFMEQKQQQKKAPATKQPNESIDEYMGRVVELMNKSNKKKVGNKKKQREPDQQTNEQRFDHIINNYGNELQLEGIKIPQIKPPEILLNYDVLFKTGKIIKQAQQKPAQSEQNPMLPFIKGKYAKAFIFNGEDFEDGPYGAKPRKIPKLPFPKHRLSLQPWEYYGVSPDEYFATKDPHFTYKTRYVPNAEFYNELPRPKAQPRYYTFDVDALLSKRYSDKHETIEFQAAFIGYKQKHWTPLSHLQMKCPQAILEYELHERNRLYCQIMQVKVKKVKIAYQYCILSYRLSKGRREVPKVVYIKAENTTAPNRITNQEVVRPIVQQNDAVEFHISEDEQEEENQRKRTSKQTRLMEEEWDPDKDDTVRAKRNLERKQRMQQHLEQLEEKQQAKQQQSQQKKQLQKDKVSRKQMESINQFQQFLDTQKQDRQASYPNEYSSSSPQDYRYKQQTKQKQQKLSKEQPYKGVQDLSAEVLISQGKQQIQQGQPNYSTIQDEIYDISDSESQNRQLTKDDLLYSKQLIEIQRNRKNKYTQNMDVDLKESMLQFQ